MKRARAQLGSIIHQDEFLHGGRRYRWTEGLPHPSAARFRGRRHELASLLPRTILPTLVRRGATREVLPVGDGERAWWVSWRCAGEGAVWALYVFPHVVAPETLSARGAPANDGALLAAWGDGPVLAWASEDESLRAILREALRQVPGFLSEGVSSADERFAVRVTAA